MYDIISLFEKGWICMLSKKYAIVDRQRCAACGACIKVCPRDAISVWKGCYAKTDVEQCVGCGKCAGICPAGCIEIRMRGEQ